MDSVAIRHRIVAEPFERVAADHLGQVRRLDLDRWFVRVGQIRFGAGLLELLGADEAVLEHALQNVHVAAFHCARAVVQRIAG